MVLETKSASLPWPGRPVGGYFSYTEGRIRTIIVKLISRRRLWLYFGKNESIYLIASLTWGS